MHSEARSTLRPPFATAFVLLVVMLRVLLWLLFAPRYGYFRDELYYLACAEHLAWGYVDQPPLIAIVTWAVRHTLGDGLHALRLLPALAHAGTIAMVALMAREMGGQRWAQGTAAVGVLIAPIYLTLTHLLTMNAWEPLIWTTGAWLVLRVVNTGDQRLWIAFGVLAGLGLENKYSMGLFGLGIACGLLLTRERRAYARPWIWVALAIALAIFLPNVLWQAHRGFPFLVLMHNVRASGRDIVLDPPAFVAEQAQLVNPMLSVVWAGGLVWLFTAGRRYAVLAWTFLVVFVTVLVLKGKSYYVAPIYPLMLAAGGVAWERWTPARWARRLATAWMALAVLLTVMVSPLFFPVLSVPAYLRYLQVSPVKPPQIEHQRSGPLQNQIYADMFGWDEMARETARAFWALPAEVRNRTAIFANDYGQAGAIDFFGPRYGLPKSICPHQSYWYWGPRQYTGESVLILRDDLASLQQKCAEARIVGHAAHPDSRRDEHFDIFWCRGLKQNLQSLWPQLRRFD